MSDTDELAERRRRQAAKSAAPAPPAVPDSVTVLVDPAQEGVHRIEFACPGCGHRLAINLHVNGAAE